MKTALKLGNVRNYCERLAIMSNETGILAMANYHRKAAEFILPETMGNFFKERAEMLGETLVASFTDDGDQISYTGQRPGYFVFRPDSASITTPIAIDITSRSEATAATTGVTVSCR